MCISDWRIGRLIRSIINTSILTSGQLLTVNASMQRIGVTLASNSAILSNANSCVITIDGKAWGLLSCNNQPIHLMMSEFGDLVTKSISLTCGTTTQTVSITEYFLPESVLSEQLESLQRPYP